MDLKTITSRRLHSQQIVHSNLATPQQVVHWLGGVQAQDIAWARWSIGLRLPQITDTAVEEAVSRNGLLRTWAFRGTLHFVSADDVGWITALLAPSIIASNARRYRQLELDDVTFNKSNRLITTALTQSPQLTRSQLAVALEAEGISAAGQRMPYLLQRAALEGLICHSIPQGRESTYMLLHSRAPLGSELPREEALAKLATRYITSHDPVTVSDFTWWSGLPATDARRAFADVTSSFLCLRLNGRELWTSEAPQSSTTKPAAYLLPPFDEYLLGYKDRSDVLDPQYAKKVNAGGGMPKPAILLDGEVIGIWQRADKRHSLHITSQPFRPLTPSESALVQEAARRYAHFYQKPLV